MLVEDDDETVPPVTVSTVSIAKSCNISPIEPGSGDASRGKATDNGGREQAHGFLQPLGYPDQAVEDAALDIKSFKQGSTSSQAPFRATLTKASATG